MSHRNHLRTKNNTISNTNKIFIKVDKTINHQRTPVKVKRKIVIPSNQQMLHKLGFKRNETTSKQKYSSEPKQDTQMEINTEITNNTSHGEKLNIIHPNSLRMFYININGMDLG